MTVRGVLRFDPGKVVATPGALDLLERSGISPSSVMKRHLTGDWGDLDPEDVAANNAAVEGGSRILSAYTLVYSSGPDHVTGQEKLWVITEADRSSTTMLLPEEY